MTLLRRALVGLVLLLVLGCASTGSPHSAGPATRRAVLHTGQGPVGLAAGGAGRLWVANADEGTVELMEASSGAVVRRVRFGDAPLRLATTPGAVWVTVFRSGSLARVDTSTGRVTRRVQVGSTPEGLALAAGSLWVVLEDSAQLVSVDPSTGRVRHRVRHVGLSPRLVTAGLGSLWVSDFEGGTIARVNPRTGRVRHSGHVCDGPQGMVVVAGRVWVACTTGEELVELDPARLAVTSRVPLAGEPDAVSAGRGGVVVVALQDGPALAVVARGSASRRPHVVRRVVLGHAGKLYDRANVDLLVDGRTAFVSSNLEDVVRVRRTG